VLKKAAERVFKNRPEIFSDFGLDLEQNLEKWKDGMAEFYPLLLERELVYRMWGGQRIATWLQSPQPYPTHIGETWEVFDTNRIRNGALAGQTLAEATRHYGAQLIGTRAFERYGADFPLLIKFIDANEKLSLQVHPDDTYAHQYEAATGFHGKTEAWYLLDAAPNATIISGLKEPMEPYSFLAAVNQHSLENLVQSVAVQTGDLIFTPPGTLHAINEGLLIFEVQQKSDLTYRVYDYGRRDPATGQLRKLHLGKALAVLNYKSPFNPKTTPLALEPDQQRMLLVACEHFALELWVLSQKRGLFTNPASLMILTLIEGELQLAWGNESLTLQHGDSVVLPAMLGVYHLAPLTATCRFLRVYIPDLERGFVTMLQRQGVSQEEISRVVFHSTPLESR